MLNFFTVGCQKPLWDLILLSGLIPSKPSGAECSVVWICQIVVFRISSWSSVVREVFWSMFQVLNESIRLTGITHGNRRLDLLYAGDQQWWCWGWGNFQLRHNPIGVLPDVQLMARCQMIYKLLKWFNNVLDEMLNIWEDVNVSSIICVSGAVMVVSVGLYAVVIARCVWAAWCCLMLSFA